MTPADAPTVFVIDDDAGVRASIQGLLKSASLRSASFGQRKNSRVASHRTGQAALFWT
jgi:FixJ family two-component response regulator